MKKRLQFLKVDERECFPAATNAATEKLSELGFIELADAGEAHITVGDTFDHDPDSAGNRVHLLTKGQRIVGISYLVNGVQETQYFAIPGEIRHFPISSAPDNWYPADGSNGTIDLKTHAPDYYDPAGNDWAVAHQFVL